MTKFLKKLCLILAIVILPLSFAACKNDGDPSTPAGSSDGAGGSAGGGDSAPVVEFKINETTANSLIDNSIITFETSLTTMNNSGILSDGMNLKTQDKTPSILEYLYYSKYFKDFWPNDTVKINAVYGYRSVGSLKYNYFKVYNTDDSALYIDYAVYSQGGYQYVGYEYTLSESGEIQKIKLDYLAVKYNNNFTIFGTAILDIANSKYEVYSIKTGITNWTTLKNKFTSGNISTVSNNDWYYSYYEKFDFGANKGYTCNYLAEDCVTEVEQNIDVLNITKGIQVYEEYQAIEDGVIGELLLDNSKNYFNTIEENSSTNVRIRYEDNKIVKKV